MIALLWLSTILDALALLALVHRRLRAPAIAAALAAKLTAVYAIGAASFGLLHLIYLDLVVALPTWSGWHCSRPVAPQASARRCSRSRCSCPPRSAHTRLSWALRLKVERTVVPVAPERDGDRDLRVAVLADIQTADVGNHEWRAVAARTPCTRTSCWSPGDLFQMTDPAGERELPELRALVRERGRGGVFVVEGDPDDPGELRRVLRGTARGCS